MSRRSIQPNGPNSQCGLRRLESLSADASASEPRQSSTQENEQAFPPRNGAAKEAAPLVSTESHLRRSTFAERMQIIPLFGNIFAGKNIDAHKFCSRFSQLLSPSPPLISSAAIENILSSGWIASIREITNAFISSPEWMNWQEDIAEHSSPSMANVRHCHSNELSVSHGGQSAALSRVRRRPFADVLRTQLAPCSVPARNKREEAGCRRRKHPEIFYYRMWTPKIAAD